MKNLAKYGLLALTMGLTSGCATINKTPSMIKVVATPIAVARDLVDVPLTTIATSVDNFADKFKGPSELPKNRGYPWGRPSAYYPYQPWGYSSWGNENVGDAAPLFEGIVRLCGFCFAAPDYIISRSGTPDLYGSNPYKSHEKDWSDHFFINTKTLWMKKETIEIPKTKK